MRLNGVMLNYDDQRIAGGWADGLNNRKGQISRG